ncbi:MAG: aminotransferase class I/II-fold pyridoxal phosphate-dependent enzyme, partial [Pyramidobacter sp.]|nr:aminotransferase class I/II-fold pyridoxal phosphate-dependent enzyme [Pyramidobacter sp.]
RVWRADELKRLLEICRRHGVLVISDEIHHDFVAEGYNHLPTLSFEEYRDMVIMLTAASKTFNMAAFKNSFVVIPNEALRENYAAFLRDHRTQTGGMFGYIAVEAAYKGGREWFEAVWKQIRANYETIRSALAEKFPKAVVTPLEATYLMWIDIGAYVPGAEIAAFTEKECGLALDYGNWFYEGDCKSDTHIRVNLATTPENIGKALTKLLAALSRRTGKA